eukprot:CAMPEP_0171065236 /NCGR_PEP_ID=MMETSP0766_2-20121228/6726_1 /TAXON_ID=439317 /ORGANISM="Gambierdiscus australes, Strain CAWD 149" /LENGTH=248 /DNA_ID=CAMNT_0011521313 /DNA_START=18 /DNA_END=764 /DNA_ORIENTATION=-
MAPGPNFLCFSDVPEEAMARLAAASTKSEVKQLLKDCMKIDQAEGFPTEILADMHYHNYSFCTSRGFAMAKTSTLLSIMKLVLEEAVSERFTASQAFDTFKELLLKHSVERPPYSVGVFAFEDIKAVMDYVHNTFFRHYRLYMYVYMTRCDLSVRLDESNDIVGTPLRPRVLHAENEVIAKDQPEFAHLYVPSESEQAENSPRGENMPEDRAAIIKRKVDAGVDKLLQRFEERIQEQDVRFKSLMDGK